VQIAKLNTRFHSLRQLHIENSATKREMFGLMQRRQHTIVSAWQRFDTQQGLHLLRGALDLYSNHSNGVRKWHDCRGKIQAHFELHMFRVRTRERDLVHAGYL